MLIAELERAVLRGDEFPGSELILAELRRCLRGSGDKVQRIGDAARFFFQPLEPFLVDDHPNHKHRGRIARRTLEPLWLWVSGTVMPAPAKTYGDAVEAALAAGNVDLAAHLAGTFQNQVAERMNGTLVGIIKDEKARRRLDTQLGTARAIEDVQTIVGVIEARDTLAMLGAQLPSHIGPLSGPMLECVKTQLEITMASRPSDLLYALVYAMNRMAAPWQLLRLATMAAGSDAAARVESTPYGVAVGIVLAELERMVRELTSDLKSGRGVGVAALLKNVHDAARGLRTELDLPLDSPWGRQLAAIRAELSKQLTTEIERVMGRTRRLLRPGRDFASHSTIDPDEIDEVEMMIGFVMACRTYAGELAVNEVTQRTFAELRQFLDSGTRPLIEALRAANEADRAFRRSQVETAVRFCGRVFGQDYAATLSKAADLAASSKERKVANA